MNSAQIIPVPEHNTDLLTPRQREAFANTWRFISSGRCWGVNLGPSTHKACVLLLNYGHLYQKICWWMYSKVENWEAGCSVKWNLMRPTMNYYYYTCSWQQKLYSDHIPSLTSSYICWWMPLLELLQEVICQECFKSEGGCDSHNQQPSIITANGILVIQTLNTVLQTWRWGWRNGQHPQREYPATEGGIINFPWPGALWTVQGYNSHNSWPLAILAGAGGSCSPATYGGHQVGECNVTAIFCHRLLLLIPTSQDTLSKFTI